MTFVNDITGETAGFIREVQRYLRTIQQARTGSSLVPVDGIFGSRTEAAVREFQQDEDLPVTGQVDRTTWEALYAAYTEVQFQQAPAAPIQIAWAPGFVLEPGERGDGVAFLQVMLRRLNQRYPQIEAESLITGVYSPATARAVREVQRLSGLPQTGSTDKATWEAVVRLYGTG